MLITVDQKVPAYKSYAAERTRGLYNVAPQDGQRFRLQVELPLEGEGWQIGMIVGPSGSGKSSCVRELAGVGWREHTGGDWDPERPIIDVLSEIGKYEKATGALASVGLGSVPSWLRPYQVLSTGERFRAEMAMLLLSDQQRIMLDEFTSVLDRQVAQVGAAAFAKSWRRKVGCQVILVTCHYDVVPFVEPDWLVDTAEGLDEFPGDRGVLKPGVAGATKTDREKYRGKAVATIKVRPRKLVAYERVRTA